MSDSTRDSLLDILLDVQSGRATVYEGADRVEATRKSDSTPVEAEGARKFACRMVGGPCSAKWGKMRNRCHSSACDAATFACIEREVVLRAAVRSAATREAALRARIGELEGALRQIIREREEDPMPSGDRNIMLCAWCEDDLTKHADDCACAIARRALGTPLKGEAP